MVDQIASPAAAAGAYAKMGKMAAAAPEVKQDGAMSFGDLLKTATVNSINTMKAGEAMSARAVTGDASLPDVVQAVNAAELTLQTVIAVRDRLVNAYQDIMRMQV